MKKITLNKIKLPNDEICSYRTYQGGEKVLVMVHGQLASSIFFEALIQDLPEEYTVYAIDMRGFGHATYNRPIDTLRDFASDLKLFVDAMNLSEFELLGWSTGGAVSMLFCASYGEMVTHLYLVASAGISGYHSYALLDNGEKRLLKSKQEIQEDPSKRALLKALQTHDKVYYKNLWSLIYNKKKPDKDILEAQLEESLRQQSLLDVYYGLTKFNISNYYNGFAMGTREVERLEMPITILQGDSDLLVFVETAKELQTAIGKNAELIVIENCGHSPMVDGHEILLRAIVEKA